MEVGQVSVHIPADLQFWIDARKRFHLSHAQVQMARELGLNPKKLGSFVADHSKTYLFGQLPVRAA